MQWDLNIGLKLKSLDHANHSVCSCSCRTPPWPEGLEKSLMAPLVPYEDVLPLLKHTNDQTLCKGVNGSSVSTLSAEISSVIAMCTGTDMLSFPERFLCRKGRRWALPLPPSLSPSLSLSLCLSLCFFSSFSHLPSLSCPAPPSSFLALPPGPSPPRGRADMGALPVSPALPKERGEKKSEGYSCPTPPWPDGVEQRNGQRSMANGIEH